MLEKLVTLEFEEVPVELEELPVLGTTAVGVEVAELLLLEPEELPGVTVAVAVGVSVGVAVEVAALLLLELEELAGVEVAALLELELLLLLFELEGLPVLGMTAVPRPETIASACAKANSYCFIYWRSLLGVLLFTKFRWLAINLVSQALSEFNSRNWFPKTCEAVLGEGAAKTPIAEIAANIRPMMTETANTFLRPVSDV